MKWTKSKLCLLSLVVLFCLSPAISSAEVCYTDEDYLELTQTFEGLETDNRQQRTRITTLETDITTSETALAKSDAATLNSEIALEKSEKARVVSAKAIAVAQHSLQEVRLSLREERKAAGIRTVLAAVIAFVSGLILGALL